MRRRFIKTRETVDEYFTIESLEDECVISLINREGLYEGLGLNVWYSLNNSHWTFANLSKNPITLKKGYKVRFKYDSPIGTFVITKKCKILGSIMSLRFMDDFKDKTSLGSSKFPWLFKGCNTIVSVDKNFLPATTLSEGCYCGMFYGCTSLVEAPILPATILTYRCYEEMFYGCNNLNYIKMLATDIPSGGYLVNWVNGVSPTGTFIKNPDAEWDVRGASGVPEGWTIKFDGIEDNLFPATIVSSAGNENLSNANIAEYFLNKYPDMVVSIAGRYTNISEDVKIIGTNYCDGKVVGVANFSSSSDYSAIIFYTENSLNNLYGLRIILLDSSLPIGSTHEWFFD